MKAPSRVPGMFHEWYFFLTFLPQAIYSVYPGYGREGIESADLEI